MFKTLLNLLPPYYIPLGWDSSPFVASNTIETNQRSKLPQLLATQTDLPSVSARVPLAMAMCGRDILTWTHEIFTLLSLTKIKSVIQQSVVYKNKLIYAGSVQFLLRII